MPPQRETMTDRLADVIQVAQLGRKTGVLTAERGSGITVEEGTITFVDGQVISASVGELKGLKALNRLNTWGACRFAFVPSAIPESPLLHTLLPDSSSTDPYLWAQGLTNGRQARLPGPKETSHMNAPAVPGRTKQLNEALRLIEHAGLSRAHRRLFLLVDGHRTTTELGRLLGRSPNEVYGLLRDLERADVIQQ